MHETTVIYDRRRVAFALAAAALLAVLLVTLVYAMFAAHQQTSGIVPAPVPVAPAAPVEPAPLPPTIVIPDNA